MQIKSFGLVSLVAAASVQAAVTIDFESDAGGTRSNGFSSVNSPLVTFSNVSDQPIIGGLSIFDAFTTETIGQSLSVEPEASRVRLQMDFSVPIYSLSLMFGNDEPGQFITLPGSEDLAVLNLYNGATLLQTVTVIPNGNDAMDQTISWIHSGTGATRAEFFYGDHDLNAFDLIETVDNITFSTTVPEPSTYAALGFAAVVGAHVWRRRKKA